MTLEEYILLKLAIDSGLKSPTIVEDSEGTPLLFDAETGNMYAITLEEL